MPRAQRTREIESCPRAGAVVLGGLPASASALKQPHVARHLEHMHLYVYYEQASKRAESTEYSPRKHATTQTHGDIVCVCRAGPITLADYVCWCVCSGGEGGCGFGRVYKWEYVDCTCCTRARTRVQRLQTTTAATATTTSFLPILCTHSQNGVTDLWQSLRITEPTTVVSARGLHHLMTNRCNWTTNIQRTPSTHKLEHATHYTINAIKGKLHSQPNRTHYALLVRRPELTSTTSADKL